MAKSQLRKIRAKRAMIAADHDGFEFVEEPQCILAVLNCGLKNGVKTEMLIAHAKVLDLIMPADKSYCFMRFESCEEAQIAFNELLGKSLWNDCPPLLLSYCSRLPQTTPCESECQPEGLILLEDFVTPEMESCLLSLIKCGDSKMKNRQVEHFGFEFVYGSNSVDHTQPLEKSIPSECDALWSLLDKRCPSFAGFRPDQLTVNQYQPGHGIPSHCDTHSIFEDPIISLSLNAPIMMEFKKPATGAHVSKILPRRSLLIMSEESRFGWTHGIVPRVSDVIRSKSGFLTVQSRQLRYSFTFRKLKVPPSCDCSHKNLCDIKPATESLTAECVSREVDENVASKLEQENVHNVYNEIGNHFSETRHSPWPNVEKFINSLAAGAIMLDVGCGNGKYLGINENITKFGCDRSDTLLQVCAERNFQAFQCDCLQIPFVNDSVDACISIAVIHHLSTQERRVQAINEILRVLRVDGLALIYVWAKDQQKENKKTRYLLQHQRKESEETVTPEVATLRIDESEIELPIHRNRTQFSRTANGNVLVPWKLRQKAVAESEQKVFLRYYHVFDDGELEALCRRNERAAIVDSYYDQGNHCVILKKL